MIARSTTQHLFASVEVEERTVLFSPSEPNALRVLTSDGARVEYRLASCGGTCRGGKSLLKCYETRVLRTPEALALFLHEYGKMFEQPGSLEKELIFAFDL